MILFLLCHCFLTFLIDIRRHLWLYRNIADDAKYYDSLILRNYIPFSPESLLQKHKTYHNSTRLGDYQ